MLSRPLIAALMLALCIVPASARLWNPTPEEQAQDYDNIVHNKGTEGRVSLTWFSSAQITSPVLQQTLDHYVVLGISHSRPGVGGVATWDDDEGVQVTDGSGTALKEVTGDAIPPTLIGMFAAADAVLARSAPGAKARWLVFQPGSISACTPGKLLVTYDGVTYNFDTPVPNCKH